MVCDCCEAGAFLGLVIATKRFSACLFAYPIDCYVNFVVGEVLRCLQVWFWEICAEISLIFSLPFSFFQFPFPAAGSATPGLGVNQQIKSGSPKYLQYPDSEDYFLFVRENIFTNEVETSVFWHFFRSRIFHERSRNQCILALFSFENIFCELKVISVKKLGFEVFSCH